MAPRSIDSGAFGGKRTDRRIGKTLVLAGALLCFLGGPVSFFVGAEAFVKTLEPADFKLALRIAALCVVAGVISMVIGFRKLVKARRAAREREEEETPKGDSAQNSERDLMK